MPINREPQIYQGYIISQIGQNIGDREYMEFKNAQNCVSSGTHRWADDKTDISPALQMKIDEQAAETLRQREADAIYFKQQKELEGAPAKSVEDLLASNARPIHVTLVYPIENDTTSKLVYLGRPFPKLTSIDVESLETMQPLVDFNEVGEIVMTFENAKARYLVVSNDGETILATLEEADQPDVDIPADWRERHFLKNMAVAKEIRATKTSMKKDEAEAIIEEWAKVDVENPENATPAQEPVQRPGEGPDAGNRDQKGFKDANGNPVTPEEKARLDAEAFVNDDGA